MSITTTFAPLPPADPAFRPAHGADVPCSELPTRIDTGTHACQTELRGDAQAVGCLPPGTKLRQFVIERVLGEGGFGVVYSAYDLALGRRVAIKEYMPAAFAVRRPDHSVQVRSSNEKQAAFAIGLKSFINEARLLAQFDHPAVAKVFQFWNEHGTAYFVMPYYTSPTLAAWLRERRGCDRQSAPIDESWLQHYFLTALDALSFLHSKGCLHRDLSPQNMLVVNDAEPLLLDFGAARRVVGEHTASLTAILKPGYAPLEQYDGNTLKQGPWTDIYALAAVMYQAMVGTPPPTAVARVMQTSGRSGAPDNAPNVQAALAGTPYSRPFIAAVELALALHPRHRPQSADELATLIRTPRSITVIAPPCVTRPVALIPPAIELASPVRARIPAPTVPLPGSAVLAPSKQARVTPRMASARSAAALVAAAVGLVAISVVGLAQWPSPIPATTATTIAATALDEPGADRVAAGGQAISLRDEIDPESISLVRTAPIGSLPVSAAAFEQSPATNDAAAAPISPVPTPARGIVAGAKPKPELRKAESAANPAGGGAAPRLPATALTLPPLLTAYAPAAEAAPRNQPAAVEAPTKAAAAELAREVLQALDKPKPQFPAEALRNGILQGRVLANFVVNPDGSVSGVRIANAAPARVFDRAVRTALETWRFAPVAAATPATVEFAFDVAR